MWRIQWYSSFVSKPFIHEEIAPHNIAKFWNLKSRNIFWPSLRNLNQVDKSWLNKKSVYLIIWGGRFVLQVTQKLNCKNIFDEMFL